MPLVIFCSSDWSAVTEGTRQLSSFLRDHAIEHSVTYENQLESDEKRRRAAFLGDVERALNTSESIILAAGCNKVKGFRYQLYCLARAQRAHHCVIHCSVAGEDQDGDFEPPNASNRWDSPLFFFHERFDSPSAIVESLRGECAKLPSPAVAVAKTPAVVTPEYLALVDAECSAIVQEKLRIRTLPLQTLQSAHRQFLRLVRQHPVARESVRQSFLDLLSQLKS